MQRTGVYSTTVSTRSSELCKTSYNEILTIHSLSVILFLSAFRFIAYSSPIIQIIFQIKTNKETHTYYFVRPVDTWASENDIIVIRISFKTTLLSINYNRLLTYNLHLMKVMLFKKKKKEKNQIDRKFFKGSHVLKFYMQPCMSRNVISALISLSNYRIYFNDALSLPSIDLYTYHTCKLCVYVRIVV